MSDLGTSIELTHHDVPSNIQAILKANEVAGQLVKDKKFFGAKAALCRALSSRPEDWQLWANLSSVMWSMSAYDTALDCAERSLSYNNHPDPKTKLPALISLGNSLMSLGQYREAEKAFEDALSIDPEYRDARWNLSLLHLLVGEYKRGWKHYHLRIEKDFDEHERGLSSKRWTGEKLAGKSIRVLHDQGIGDTIMYSRFLPELVAKYYPEAIYMSTVPQLVPLLWDFTEVGVEFVHSGAPLPRTDYHVHLGTIPAILGLKREEVPPPSKFVRDRALKDMLEGLIKVEVPEPQVKPALKIGICWSGREEFSRNKDRSVPLKTVCALADSSFFWLYSLQCGPQSAEIKELGMDKFIYDLSPQLQTWTHTAIAMLKMDVIVTCCTSVAHLAGSLGVPTCVMLCKEPYWPWGDHEDVSPWYPSAHLFRQKRWGDWGQVITEVHQHLLNLLGQRTSP